MSDPVYEPINTTPVKRFFVEMLTRDISVEDAILDLLDNCVDGLLREIEKGETAKEKTEKPYEGFWASIDVDENSFLILDNCGGIPWKDHEKAFRMGRPPGSDGNSSSNGVGAYGIGMKRAIFKMGEEATIATKNGEHAYEINFSPDWMHNEDSWHLDVKPLADELTKDGTSLHIQRLYEGVKDRFSSDVFVRDLIEKIESHYAVIIEQGFSVKVNDKEVKPKPISLRADFTHDTGIRPYVFRANYKDEIDIFIAIGLRDPVPSVEHIMDEAEAPRFSSESAGWTIICNDRVVLYCNRDELTGWGTAGVPRYHTQFIAISGVVEFRGNPTKLPTTTTKRGLDFSSAVYQQVLDRMREGMLLFINFTNKWKSREDEAKELVLQAPSMSYSEFRSKTSLSSDFHAVSKGIVGEQIKPTLPIPFVDRPDWRITYSRDKSLVLELADVLIQNVEEYKTKDIKRLVGEGTFDFAYKALVENLEDGK